MSCGDAGDAAQGSASDEKKFMPRKKQVRRADRGTCQRCQEAKTLYVIRTVTYCAACFRLNIISRMIRQMYPPLRVGEMTRSVAMSKQRPPKARGNALIALSGGAGSIALLDIMTDPKYAYVGRRDAIEHEAVRGSKRPVWENGTAVYVEFCGVVDGMEDRTEDMRRLADERGLGFLGLRAEDVFDPSLEYRLGCAGETPPALFADLSHSHLPIASSSSSLAPLVSLRNLLSSLPPPSRPSLLSRILDHLLTLAANSLHDVSHLLLGETSSRQAERIISGTALGRGWALPLELAAAYKLPSVDQLESHTFQLKPLKDITIREAAIWCHLSGLPTINSRGWGSIKGKDDGKRDARGKGGVASLEMLTEQFIAGLSVTHPSTVSTINRTGEKLVFPGDAQRNLCPVCEHPVDPSALDWKSRTALMSLPTKDVEPASTLSAATSARLAPLLCYSCLTTFTPARIGGKQADPEPIMLPLWVSERVSSQTMKEEIGEFLLDTGDDDTS